MIESLAGFPDNVAAFRCSGRVTRRDYETVLIPAVERKLQAHDKVRVYYETAADFAGIDAGAMWEDLKTGIGHFASWERMAVVTDEEWIRHAMRAFGFLLPGELRVFPLADAAQARAWIASA